MPKRRPKGGGLRGWWRSIPFLLAGFGLMFLFTWLERQRLNNEYRAQELTEEISEVKARMRKLHEQRHHLNRMERMEHEAPLLDLVEADPGQIILIRAKNEGQILAPSPSREAERVRTALTRSATLFLGPLDSGENVTILQDEAEGLAGVQDSPR